jgi:hypothetical protein
LLAKVADKWEDNWELKIQLQEELQRRITDRIRQIDPSERVTSALDVAATD